jgi:hypothetical protein
MDTNTTPVERVDQILVDMYKDAQQNLANAQTLLHAAQGAMNFVMATIGSRHSLQAGDELMEDGTIVRTKKRKRRK